MEKQLVVNVGRCNGCRMCEMACSLEKEGECSTQSSRIKIIRTNENLDVPRVCLQCEDPLCESVCPVNAVTRDSNGAIAINYDSCVECKMCLSACPIGAITVNPHSRGIIKCDLCNGDPMCVRFCQPKAIEYVGKNKVDTIKDSAARSVLESIKSEQRLKPGGSRSK